MASRTILFVGDSFTHGKYDPVRQYNAQSPGNPDGVIDENAGVAPGSPRAEDGSGEEGPWGGIPGIFQIFVDEAGLSYSVHIEAISAENLKYQYDHALPVITQSGWTDVVLQDESGESLNPGNPGNPDGNGSTTAGEFAEYSARLEHDIHDVDAATNVFLYETWAPARSLYMDTGSAFYGLSVQAATQALHTAFTGVAAQDTHFAGVAGAGDAWAVAIANGVAEANPYAPTPGALDLWSAVDNYHPSIYGAYLSALALFRTITGIDPRSLGSGEAAASALGISPVDAAALQNIAAIACYLRGTRIRNETGEVAIENLRIGDAVPTAGSGLLPIRWIGRRRYEAGGADMASMPVLIRAGAIADGLPARDLFVSPKHALCIDGVLVPAECLINDATVLRLPQQGAFEYFHLEFDRPETIWAEAMPAESFVDCDSRGLFDNAAEFAALYPGATPPRWQFALPRVEHGPQLAAIRRRIDARAGLCSPAESPDEQRGALQGNLEHADLSGIAGWAFNPQHPRTPVRLEYLVDGVARGDVICNMFRADLHAAGLGDGCCGFNMDFDDSFSDGVELLVRRKSDRAIVGKALIGRRTQRRAA